MNGVHDLGGMHGMGPIDTDPNEPLFHAEWERRAFAITLALASMAAGTSTSPAMPARTGIPGSITSAAATTSFG